MFLGRTPKDTLFSFHPLSTTFETISPEIDKDTNRIEELRPDGDQQKDYEFDAAGNMILDPDGRQFFYDGENKQIRVEDISDNIIGEYVYDGDGRRVMKKVPLGGGNTETTVFVYDAGGKLVAEYSTTVASQSTAQVSYLTNDHLGSPRITTDKNGKVYSRRDFLPFGEELDISVTAERTSAIGYGSDSVRQKFTGYERDDESNLNYAINRYYNGGNGRFSSVDPYNIIFEMKKGEDEADRQEIFLVYISQPQIWNKYSYSFNNPLKYSDPDGRRPITQQEEDNLRRFISSGMAYADEITDATQRQNFINAVNAAADAIRNAIAAVPNDAKEDPKNLRAVLYAMAQISDPQNTAKWSGGGSVGFNSNGANVKLGRGSNKCTIFVGVAYAKGANIGWNNNGNTGGYQVNWSWRGNVYTPVANDLVTGGATNFEEVARPQLGDIAAGHGTIRSAGIFYNTYNQGHAGIVVAGEVVISANPTHGVRVGRFSPTSDSNAGFKYLRYKP